MKNHQTILCIILGIIIITTACHHEESINNGTTVNTNCESIQITARYAMSHQPASKTLITPVNNNPQYGLSVLWAKNDLICLVQSANGTEQARELLLTEGAGQTTATFTGKGFETSEEGAENLKILKDKIDITKMKAPSFLMVLIGVGDYAYRRPSTWQIMTTCPLQKSRPSPRTSNSLISA